MNINEVRSFYAKVMKGHGIYLTEICQSDGLWCLEHRVIEQEEINAICPISFLDIRKRTYAFENRACYGNSQEELWMKNLLKWCTSEGTFFKIRSYKRYRNEDGIIEIRWKDNFVFGCDVTDCNSWEEIKLKTSIVCEN